MAYILRNDGVRFHYTEILAKEIMSGFAPNLQIVEEVEDKKMKLKKKKEEEEENNNDIPAIDR